MQALFELWAHEPCLTVTPIMANGSNRHYFRLEGSTHKCIAAVNGDIQENDAFIYFAKEMRQRGLRVPQIYAVGEDHTLYLQEDLGDTTMYAYFTAKRQRGEDVSAELVSFYRRVLDDLILFQTRCRDLDFSHAYPRADFDRQSIQWDLNYFKYYFLKLAYIPFNEQLLENDFDQFIDFLLNEDCTFFLYRDFQARNVMINPEGELYYIDFQGGRRGAAQYDVAALLYSAKSEIPEYLREELLDYYIDHLAQVVPIDKALFRSKFYGYVLVRMMQAMGTYGYRGYFEKKDYFIRSIPLAVANLRSILNSHQFPIHIPELQNIWRAISCHEDFQPKTNRLNVRIFSFSYRKGIPQDKSGNGGGFVFDCRALPNPGRYEQYKSLCGKDKPVVDYLEDKPEVIRFNNHVRELVCPAIENYLERGFSNLMINFGCTGGQHRSVYCAEKLAAYVRQNYDCRVVMRHIEQGNI